MKKYIVTCYEKNNKSFVLVVKARNTFDLDIKVYDIITKYLDDNLDNYERFEYDLPEFDKDGFYYCFGGSGTITSKYLKERMLEIKENDK